MAGTKGTWDKYIATVGCAGLSPIAPGTVGALVALPLALGLTCTPLWVQLSVFMVVTLIGTWAAHEYQKRRGGGDPQEVVIDEFAGILLTFIGVSLSIWTAVLGFALFRFFDILKPQPIRWIDQKIPGGWGIMADDLVAGLFARAVLALVTWQIS